MPSPDPTAAAATDDDVNDDPAFASAQVQDAPQIPIRTVFRRFWPDTRPFRGRMLTSLVLTAATPATTTAAIWLFKVLVDEVLTPADIRPLPGIAAAYLGITVLGGVVTYADEYLSAWVAERFVMGLRIRLFDHIGSLSVAFFEKRPLGDILSRLTADVTSIEQMVLTGVNLVLTYSFQIVFYSVALLVLDWRLTLIASVAVPVFLLLSRALSRRIADAAREMRRRSGSITAVAEESLANAALVQAYDRRAGETERFRGENEASFVAGMRAARLEGLFGPVSGLVQAVGVLLVVGFAVGELRTGGLSLGGLLVFVTYLSQLYGPVAGFGGLANSLFAARAGAERIIEVLDDRPEVTEPEHPRPLGRATGAIAVEDVGFGYPGRERAALHGLSFTIPPGGRVAVVGASGAGKSTLVKLLLRFHDPEHGRVTLDGRDLRDLPLSDLRGNVTAVLQDTLVFDGTVEENIRWARPDATADEIVAAARAADVDEFVADLPDGYRTRIGQRGRLLSGGQRQRLAIARAMVRDSPVLVLDEPTTGLDAEATERVLAPLRRLMAGRTTIIISHNLPTVADADRILFLEDGELTAAGTHAELLRDSPGYARLHALHRSGGVDPAPAGDADAVGPGSRPDTELDPEPDAEPDTAWFPVVGRRIGRLPDPVDAITARLPLVPVLRTIRLPVLPRPDRPGPDGGLRRHAAPEDRAPSGRHDTGRRPTDTPGRPGRHHRQPSAADPERVPSAAAPQRVPAPRRGS